MFPEILLLRALVLIGKMKPIRLCRNPNTTEKFRLRIRQKPRAVKCLILYCLLQAVLVLVLLRPI